MIQSLRKIWQKIANLGLEHSADLQERSRIKLLNNLIVASFTISLFLALVRIFEPEVHLPGVFILLSLIVTAYFNFTFKHFLARTIACTTYPVGLTAMIVIDGAPFGEFLIYSLIIFLTFILFENKKKLRNLIITWNFVLAIGAYIYIKTNFPANLIADNSYGTLLLFSSSVLVLCYLITFYQTEIETNKREKDKILIDLKQSNTELEKFAYIVSHDLKEPLRNIIGFNTLIEKNIDSNNTEAAKEFLSIVHSSSKMMNDLIEDTLEMVSSNKNKKPPQNVDLNEVIEQVKLMIADTLEQKNASIQILNKLPNITAVKTEMISTFKNLIENGVKFNQKKQPTINIDYWLKGNSHLLSIADNGKGIEEEYFNKIFEMYSRLETKSKYPGTGLGLAICKKTIEKMNGEIYVESTLGEGSTFFIRLPVG